MKIIGILVFLVTGTISLMAQSSPLNVEFKKSLRPALMLPLPFNSETAEQTILAKLKETGYKPAKSGSFLNKKNKEEGYYKFPGVVLPELANQQLDLYFKVVPVDNDSSTRSSITLLVSKGYDNFVSDSSDSSTFLAAENFLNGFVENTNVYNINQKLDKQRKDLASSEKKWSDVRDRQLQTKRKITELEGELKSMQEEEQLQQQEVEKLRSGVRDLEAQRPSAQR
jgi:hypothetical protein